MRNAAAAGSAGLRVHLGIFLGGNGHITLLRRTFAPSRALCVPSNKLTSDGPWRAGSLIKRQRARSARSHSPCLPVLTSSTHHHCRAIRNRRLASAVFAALIFHPRESKRANESEVRCCVSMATRVRHLHSLRVWHCFSAISMGSELWPAASGKDTRLPPLHAADQRRTQRRRVASARMLADALKSRSRGLRLLQVEALRVARRSSFTRSRDFETLGNARLRHSTHSLACTRRVVTKR